MLLLLAKFAGVAIVAVVMAAVRMHRAHRRRDAVETGGTATCRGVLSTGDGPFRSGRLLLSGARVVWQSRRGDVAVELSGGQAVAAGEVPQGRARNGDVLLRLMLPGAVPARLILQEDDAATLVELLPRTEAPPAGTALPVLPEHRLRPWALVSLGLAATWVLVWVVLVLDGDTVPATITGGDGDGTCTVAYRGTDGGQHTGEVDCSDQPAGTELSVWALGWPATGDVEDPAWTVGGVSFIGALLATPGAVSLLRNRRRRTPTHASAPEPVTPRVDVPVQDAPPLSAEDVRPLPGETPGQTLQRLAARAVRQIPVDGWENAELPAGNGPPLLFTLLLRAVRVPVAVLVGAVVLAWLFAGSWYVLAGRDTSTAAGISTGDVSTESHWPLPDMVTVRFPTSDGNVHEADVPTLTSLPEGRRVTVEYAVGQPGAARLVGPADGLGRSAALTTAGVALVLLFIGYRLRSATAGLRAARAAAELPPNPVIGLLTADRAGNPLLLACSPAGSPLELYAVPLETPLPHGTAARFVAQRPLELRLRGRLADGGTVVPEVGGTLLWPAAPAALPDADDLVVLLDSVGALTRSADGE